MYSERQQHMMQWSLLSIIKTYRNKALSYRVGTLTLECKDTVESAELGAEVALASSSLDEAAAALAMLHLLEVYYFH